MIEDEDDEDDDDDEDDKDEDDADGNCEFSFYLKVINFFFKKKIKFCLASSILKSILFEMN